MNYSEINIELTPVAPFREILVALLAEIGYESFVDHEAGLKAYIQEGQFSDSQLNKVLESLQGVELYHSVKVIQHKNWNEEWEKDYHPVEIDERCVIRALFHELMPQYKYEIIIQPQMSFGTGHHPTTLLMAKMLLDLDIENKNVLDLGSGTGVLAILAEKKGARSVVATDIEDHIVENAKDNVRHNDCKNIRVDKADMTAPAEGSYELILANINLNTLLSGLKNLIGQANKGATVLMSGFYQDDAALLIERAKSFGLHYVDQKTKDRWAVIQFEFDPSRH